MIVHIVQANLIFRIALINGVLLHASADSN